MRLILILCLICCMSGQLLAQQLSPAPVLLKSTRDLMMIGQQTAFLEDPDGNMQLADILQPENQAKFRVHDREVFARPGTPSAFWFKFTVQNHTEEDAWMEVGTTYAWYIDFYAPDSAGQYTFHHRTGSMLPNETKLYDVNLYWFPVNKAFDTASKTYYIRVVEGLAFELPLQVGTIRSLSKNKDINDYLSAGFVGLMLIMILYNLFLYLSTRDHIYGLYIGYLFLMMVAMTYATSYPFILELDLGFLNRQNLNQYFIWWHAPAYFFVGTFCIKYLNLSAQKGPFARNLIIGLLVLMLCVLAPLSLIVTLPAIINFFQLSVLLLYFTCIITAYYFVFKGDKQARFYAIGWTLMIGFVFVFFTVVNGLVEFNPFTRNTLYIGTSLEVWMFSLALGDRMNIIRREKEQAQAENFRLIEEQKITLERKVHERTKALYEANAEMQAINEELNSTLEVVRENKAVIEAKNENITASINYAKRIQRAILPAQEDFRKYFDEYFVLFKPTEIVSGDFYYFHQKEDKIIAAAIDCTGHGVPGALMTMLASATLDEIIQNRDITRPDLILNELHKGIRKSLRQTETDNRDGMDLVMLAFDRQTPKVVEFAGAKNSLIYFQHQQLHQLKGDRMPIGGDQREQARVFTLHTIALKADQPAVFYLFTDGYQDQFGGPNQRKFMIANLRLLLEAVHQLPLEQQSAQLDQTIVQWIEEGHEKQMDDILIIGLKV